MNRKFLIMVATICGLAMVISLLLLPILTYGSGEHSQSVRAIMAPAGGFVLLFAWIAAGFGALVFFKKTDILGMNEARHMAISFLGYKLTMFFLIALLIEGPMREGSWGVGFWLAFIAGLVGTLAVFLTFNPALAQKLADAAKSKEEEDAKPAEKKDDA